MKQTLKIALGVLAAASFGAFALWFLWELLTCDTPPPATQADTLSVPVMATRDTVATVKPEAPKPSNMMAKLENQLRYLDSNRYYYHKAMAYKEKRDEMEILYLRTEVDIYRIKGNRYADLAHKYGRKANAWNDSLQKNAQ